MHRGCICSGRRHLRDSHDSECMPGWRNMTPAQQLKDVLDPYNCVCSYCRLRVIPIAPAQQSVEHTPAEPAQGVGALNDSRGRTIG